MSEKSVKLNEQIIEGFFGGLLSGSLDEAAPTPECHREWWKLFCSPHKRVAIAAPRGHAKSTAVTKTCILASVLFRDRSYVLLLSDTYQQAVQFLAEIKREFISNEDLIEMFGIKSFDTDREDDIIVVLKDDYKFRITALGSEQKVRGRLWEGKRPDLIVCDDMENDEIVQNQDRRIKFRTWFQNALLPCMSERGKVRIVGTILHMDSFLENKMPKDKDPNSVHADLYVRMLKPKEGWYGVRYAAHGPDATFNKMLWPIKWTKERLQELQSTFVADGNPEGYYQEYLNRPIDPSHSFFRKDDFLPFEDFEYQLPFERYPTYLSCDLAVTEKQKRDYCAFGVVSIGEDGTVYVRHVIRERMDPKEIINTVLQLKTRYANANVLLIGKGMLEKSIGPFLRDVLRRNNKFLYLHPIAESNDKRYRAQSIRGRMRAGGVKFNKKGKWYPEFEGEMLRFDRDVHDDQVDMMSLVGMYLDQSLDAPSKQELEEEIWEEEMLPTMIDSMNEGRSEITGY